MERYPKYKDSGIPWLGQIPEHWAMKRAKYMFLKNKRERRPEDEVITCFRDGQVTLRKNRRTTGFTESEKYDGYQGIRKGDLVIHQMDAFAGSVGVSDSDGMGTSVYHCCTPLGDYNVYYYAYLIRHMALTGYIQSLYKGIRERSSDFSFPIFGNQFLAIPPLPEQEKIVEYIRRKADNIDTYIAERERELQVLTELKQSQIAEAVTHGLNHNAPMRDSGIPWVGMIPEHWDIKQLRAFLKLFSEKGHGDAQLLSVTREQGVILRDKENKEENHNFVPEDLSGYKYIQRGDFVVNKMKAWQGSYAVSNYDGIVSPAYYTCKLIGVDKEFFSLAIRSKVYVCFFSSYSKGIRVGQWDLEPNALKSIPFFLPPIDEQQAIVDYINAKCSQINRMISEIEKEIICLKEYKQRMIADAVTGAICVL